MKANVILRALKGFETRGFKCVDEILEILRVKKFEDFNFASYAEEDLIKFWNRVRMIVGSSIRIERYHKRIDRAREANTEVVEATIKTIWNESQRLFQNAIRGFESKIKINGATISIFGDMHEVNFMFDGETDFYSSNVYNRESTSAQKYLYRVLKERAII